MSRVEMSIYEAVKNNVIPLGSLLTLCLSCVVLGWISGVHTSVHVTRKLK